MIKDFNKVAIIAGQKRIMYSEMLQRITLFAEQSPKEAGAKTIILSENREGWIYAFFGIWANKGIAIPVDATSTVSDISYIIKDCKPDCIWTSVQKLDTVKEALKDAQIDTKILIIDDYESVEVNKEKAVIEYSDDDVAVIIYTSGTTGSPKGVMLTFGNLMANIHSVADEVPIFNEERRALILLPLHHVLPLQGSVIAPITRGGGVAISPSMTAPDLMNTLKDGKVSIIIGVPRLYQTLFGAMKKKIDSNFVTRFLFWMCSKVGSRSLSRTIFKSVRTKMGGHIDYLVCGGAALDREIGVGLKTLGLDVLEGYGMTETAPIIAFTRPDDIVPGSCGKPMPSVQTKILETGELCAKGPNVMKGYYNRPEETAAILDNEGWMHTGDLARFDDQGRLYITGRTKEIIVLSNGKNVNPSEIEYKIEKYDSIVKEAAIVQDGDMLRAIIVAQNEWLGQKTDEEAEEALKREVLAPYNETVAQYKKVMSVFLYRGDLPRTKLDKIQRFKLKGIIESGVRKEIKKDVVEPTFEEYKIIKQYIESEKKITVRPTDHIETDLAFDSLDRVGLQSFIEQTFGTELKADVMASFKNVTEIAEQVAKVKTRQEVEQVEWHKLFTEHKSNLKLPDFWFTGHIFTWCCKVFAHTYLSMEVKGLENLPKDRSFIIAPNHVSYMDGLLVVTDIPNAILNNTYFYVKEDHVRGKLLRFLASHHNIILMERMNLMNSILKMGEVLRSGKNLVIFPEGTRTRNGETGQFKKTFAILSKELNVPIVPVAITGAYEAMPKGRKFPLAKKVTVEYLPPVTAEQGISYVDYSEKVKQMIVDKVKK